jgi:hypothetical protein
VELLVICPNCAQPTQDSSKFCTQCGKAIGNSPPPPLPPFRDTPDSRQPTEIKPRQARGDGTVQSRIASLLFGMLIGVLILAAFGLYLVHVVKRGDDSKATANTSSTATHVESAPQPASTTASVVNPAEDTYTAYLTCGMNGFENINVLACYTNNGVGTTLELHNGAAYGLYKVYDLSSVGTDTAQGFAIRL